MHLSGKSTLVNILIISSISVLWILFFYYGNKEIRLKDYKNVGAIQKSKKNVSKNISDFTINFDFYINKTTDSHNNVIYEDIFQTANYNDGFRLEFIRSNNNISELALVYTDTKNIMHGLNLGVVPDLAKWHNLGISYSTASNNLSISYDYDRIKSLNTGDIKLNFSKVISGRGFDKKRVFNGSIRHFVITNNDGKILLIKYLLYVLSFSGLFLIFKKYTFPFIRKIGLFFKNTEEYNIFLLVSLLFLVIFALKYFSQYTLPDYTDYNQTKSLEHKLSIKKDFSIKFDMLIDPVKERFEGIRYENIFQTANWNDGIRIELARKSENDTLWGLIYTNKLGTLKSVDLGTIPSESKWHHVAVNYMHDKNRIDVFVNGICLSSLNDVNMQPKFSRVIAGKAFEDRVFHGKIKNFTIQKGSIPIFLYLIFLVISMFGFVSISRKNATNYKPIMKRVYVFFLFTLVISLLIFTAESFLVGENAFFRFSNILLTVLLFIFLIAFMRKIRSKAISVTGQTVIYAAFCGYLSMYLSSALYMLGKISNQVRSPYGLSLDEIAAIYQSSVTESSQFIITNLGYSALAVMIIIPFAGTVILFAAERFITPLWKRNYLLIYSFVIIIAFYFLIPTVPTYPKAIYAGFERYSQIVSEMKKMSAKRRQINFDLSVTNNMKGTHIIVIGESENRDHMGAYGYFRNTTPWLSKESADDADNIVLLTNTYAPYCHTIPSIMKTLTEANQYNKYKQNQAISIIDIANKAGFNTYWISEQHGAMIDTPLSMIINESRKVKYVEEGGHIIKTVQNLMKDIDRSKNNLIVIHLMGSHADYNQRLKYEKFRYKDKEQSSIGNLADDKAFTDNILNPYDSTIRQTDYILQNLHNATIEKYDFVDSFVYFSDHGEDVFGQKFHNSANFSYPMVRIPLFMTFSDRFKNNVMKSDYDTLKSRESFVFTNDLLFNTLLDIYQIKSSHFEKGYSLLKQNYKINENNALTMQKSPDEDTTYYTMTTAKYVKNDPEYISKKNLEYLNSHFPDKILSSNNDISAKTYQSYILGFQGIEFNVALENMHIGHYPEYVFDTSVESFLNIKPVKQFKRLWFDIKSPENKDIGYSLNTFEKLDIKYHIKHRALIESWENGLDKFSKNGWNTSYYIKTKSASDQPRDEKYASVIAGKIKSSHAEGVSFAYEDYDFVKKYVEPDLPEDISYHVFGLPENVQISNPNMKNEIKNYPVFKDPKVKTILLEAATALKYWPTN